MSQTFHGPTPKMVGRQRMNKIPAAPLRPEEQVAMTPPPLPPEELSDVNKRFWVEFWVSNLARAVDPKSDMPAILRLFELYDGRDRLDEVWRSQQLIVDGVIEVIDKLGNVKTQNAIKVNPLRSVIAICDDQIMKLEDRFGLNPLSRLRLGIKFEELSAKMRKAPEREPAEDPRKVLRMVQ